ncbi:hypothetical protein VNO78_15042 [Psophocarpus tetragonolobus]|uniref:non-specific serine/threonine protein kinase n=1 Tax=Psophocarpus tetragonolobus TaxID=3891 RepID=A0AAN9XJJ5_PSOTE
MVEFVAAVKSILYLLDGKVCNEYGSITGIKYPYVSKGIQLATLNLSAFKNLERLEVRQRGLEGPSHLKLGGIPDSFPASAVIGNKGLCSDISAHALSYLHHDCNPPIVHRDISASNVLLNSEWEPSVGDFGTARLLQHDSSYRTIVAGTIGYIAPSFVGKHPKEILSWLQSQSSHSIKLYEVLDQRLPAPDMTVFLDIVRVVLIALACLNPNPHDRPTMEHVSQCFLTQITPLVVPLRELSLQQLMSQARII